MPLLQKLGTGQGWLKAGFLGFPKSGKTWTATELAIGSRAFFKSKAPIAFFDTEGGSEYVASRIRGATGCELLGIRSRAFSDLLAVARECEAGAASFLVVDSISHVWRELCDSHLKAINDYRKTKNLSPRKRLEFQDWNVIKAAWAEWTDFYLNSKLHIAICGRAGFEYDFQEHEQSDGSMKKELVKTGVKMKVESEFGFEPSLLVEMERVQIERDGKFQLLHRATILGERFGVIDGKECDNPTFDFFKPHVELLVPGAHAPIDTTIKSSTGIDEHGEDAAQRERRQRTIALEEIQGEISRMYPGQTAAEKNAKLELLENTFGTRSWTAVECKDVATLKAGLATIRGHGKENVK